MGEGSVLGHQVEGLFGSAAEKSGSSCARGYAAPVVAAVAAGAVALAAGTWYAGRRWLR